MCGFNFNYYLLIFVYDDVGEYRWIKRLMFIEMFNYFNKRLINNRETREIRFIQGIGMFQCVNILVVRRTQYYEDMIQCFLEVFVYVK